MCQVTKDENKENDTKSPFFENPSDEGPSGNVVEENKQHGRKHPDKLQVKITYQVIFTQYTCLSCEL